MKRYVINLESRPDRLSAFTNEMNNLGFVVERFNALSGNIEGETSLLPGEIGCRESHRNIIKQALIEDLEMIMIFEDDFEATPDFLIQYDGIMNNIPTNFDFIQFGANVQDYRVPYNQYLDKCYGMFAAHCYIVSNRVYDDIINCRDDHPIDVIYRNIHKRGNSYMSNKKICGQRKDYSNIQNGVVDYRFLL